MAAELAETTRLYARCVAKIEPEWIEPVAQASWSSSHYFDPHWEKERAMVVACERVTLYGLTIVPKRRVHYGPINPQEAREIFIRQALVAGEYETRAPFFAHNQRLIEEVAGTRAQGAPPRRAGRRAGAVRVLRRADPAGHPQRRGVREMARARPRRRTRSCCS